MTTNHKADDLKGRIERLRSEGKSPREIVISGYQWAEITATRGATGDLFFEDVAVRLDDHSAEPQIIY